MFVFLILICNPANALFVIFLTPIHLICAAAVSALAHWLVPVEKDVCRAARGDLCPRSLCRVPIPEARQIEGVRQSIAAAYAPSFTPRAERKKQRGRTHASYDV